MQNLFDVPYNGDPCLIEYYIQNRSAISMVYGRAEDGYPQGRKTNKGVAITLNDIFEQNNRLKQHGIRFNYLLNGTSHGNKEYDRVYRNEFVRFVKNLKDHDITTLTIGNLFLLEVIRNELPDLEVSASILLEIDSLIKVKTVAELGVTNIFLSKILLKNFNALRNIHRFNEDNPRLTIYLLANDPCIRHCLYTNYHNNTLSIQTSGGQAACSFCRLKCTKRFATNVGDYNGLRFRDKK